MDEATIDTRLTAFAAAVDVTMSADQVRALRHYCTRLLEWNQTINLTGARSISTVVDEHLPDSFAAAALLDGATRIVDVGSGGGLPAVPAAILTPRGKFTLVEPRSRRVAFLRTVCRELRLDIDIETCRLEEMPRPGVGFDAAMSRATFSPEEWLTIGRAWVRPGGIVLAFCPEGVAHRLGPPTAERVVTLAGHDVSAHRE